MSGQHVWAAGALEHGGADVVGIGGGRAPEVVDERREVELGLSAAEAQRGWRRRP
jgi:hypothetical protein